MRFKNILLTFLFALPIMVWAQVTTGTLTGVAKNDKGEALSGATITAVHLPTGSKYSTIAKSGGQYTIPNLRVGGPYTITIHFTGYGDAVFNDLNVGLGNPLVINGVLTSTSQALSGVTVVGNAKGSIISSQRSGTSTYLSPKLIQSVPSINRNIQDYARLMPQAKAASSGGTGNGAGVSFGGQNNRYNQFSIDGANASDAFGLSSSGTNGGSANINPISMEAIQEMQIILSPYDVAQGGFVGGGINAVTKSGTNTLHGAVYGQSQPKGIIGKSASYNDGISRNPIYGDYNNYTYGGSLGGALIKNKLFFFVAAEHFEKSTPLTLDPTVAGSGSNVNVTDLANLSTYLKNNYNYDPGSYGAISNGNKSTSVFGRIDWNINDKNKLVVRFNHVDGYLDVLTRGPNTGVFANSGYRINNQTNSAVVELNTSFNSSTSNVLRLTYSTVRENRTTSAFPTLSITNYNTALATPVNVAYTIGAENSSAANSLNQDIFTITDNVTLYKGHHTLTFGTNNEFFNSKNVFLQSYYGRYTYALGGTTTNNITNFMTNTGMTAYTVGFSNSQDPADKAPASVNAAQFSVYGGDAWAVNNKFKLTYGLRIDLPVFFNTPDANASFNSSAIATKADVTTNQMPKTQPLFSPRIGFNWDAEGDGSIQIRGGAGLFTGRVPFVWISNNFSMTGVKSSSYSPPGTGSVQATNAAIIAAAGIKFPTSDAAMTGAHLGAFLPAAGNATPTINVVDKNFKFPQVFRANIAADKKLNVWGLISTFELVYTKTLNNANYTNLNQTPGGDGTVTTGSAVRPFWKSNASQNTAYAQVLELSNSSQGYAFSATAQLQKPVSQGWSGSIAYTYGHSTSANDLTSSVAFSNWTSPLTANGLNNPQLATSNFNLGQRIVGYISKEFRYAKHFATTFTLIYTGQSGQGFSYVSGSLLGDGGTALAYIPKNVTEANFTDIKSGAVITSSAGKQWADFQTFSASNNYLTKYAGQVSERNGDNMPFENHFDLRIAQDIQFKNHKLQLFVDILNIGNLLNKEWGWSYSSLTGTSPDGFFTASANLFTVINTGTNLTQTNGSTVTTVTPTVNNPAFNFNLGNFTKIKDTYRPYAVSDYTSRYSAQIGARYSF